MFKKLNKNLLGISVFFIVAIFAVFFANQSGLYKGSVTSSTNLCVSDEVEEYAHDVMEDIKDLEGEVDFDDEAEDVFLDLQTLLLLFDGQDFNYDKENLFLNKFDAANIDDLDKNARIRAAINDILVANNCEAYNPNDLEIEDYDFEDKVDRDEDFKEYSPTKDTFDEFEEFKFELNEDINATRSTTNNKSFVKVENAFAKFYIGDSESVVNDDNLKFELPVFLDEDELDDGNEIGTDGAGLMEYESKDLIVYVNGFPLDNMYRGIIDSSYIPTGDYMMVVEIDGVKFEPQEVEIDGDDIDICEYLTEDTDISGYGKDGLLQILMDKLDDFEGMYDILASSEEALLEFYEFIDDVESSYGPIVTDSDYDGVLLLPKSAMYHLLETFTAMAIDNNCEVDLEDYEDIKSDFIDIDVDDFSMQIEFEDTFDSISFVDPDGEEFNFEFGLTNIPSNDFDITKSTLFDTAIISDSDEAYYVFNRFEQCGNHENSVFGKCKEGDYLVRASVDLELFAAAYESEYFVYEYKLGDEFEVKEPQDFYSTNNDYIIEVVAKDSNLDDDINISTNADLDADNDFEMENGKGSFDIEFNKPGYFELELRADDGDEVSRIGFYVIDEDAYDEAQEILEDLPESRSACELELQGTAPFVSVASPVTIGMDCNENSDRTVVNLYSEQNDQAIATLYSCLNSTQCDGRKSILWNTTTNGRQIINGSYYIKASFEVDGKKILPKKTESFAVNNNAGGVVPGGVFPDVPANHPYAAAINWMKSSGYIQGFQNGTFGPEICVKRAELVKMVAEASRQVGFGASQTVRSYPDVNYNDWFYPYVQNATSRGWVQGYEDGTFKPERCVTRVEAIKVALIANTIPTMSIPDMGWVWADVRFDEWYSKYFYTAITYDLVGLVHQTLSSTGANGMTVRYFYPAQGMTRAEVAEMLYRISQKPGLGNQMPHASGANYNSPTANGYGYGQPY